jgi:hypothetical protein
MMVKRLTWNTFAATSIHRFTKLWALSALHRTQRLLRLRWSKKRMTKRSELLKAEVVDLRKQLESLRLKIEPAATPEDESEDVNVP